MAVIHGAGAAMFKSLVATGFGRTVAGNPTVLVFFPPTRKQTTMMRGSLRYSYVVSETVWRDADGVWQHAETPATETLNAASQLLAVSGRPQIVDQDTADALTAAGIGTIQNVSREDATQWE